MQPPKSQPIIVIAPERSSHVTTGIVRWPVEASSAQGCEMGRSRSPSANEPARWEIFSQRTLEVGVGEEVVFSPPHVTQMIPIERMEVKKKV